MEKEPDISALDEADGLSLIFQKTDHFVEV